MIVVSDASPAPFWTRKRDLSPDPQVAASAHQWDLCPGPRISDWPRPGGPIADGFAVAHGAGAV